MTSTISFNLEHVNSKGEVIHEKFDSFTGLNEFIVEHNSHRAAYTLWITCGTDLKQCFLFSKSDVIGKTVKGVVLEIIESTINNNTSNSAMRRKATAFKTYLDELDYLEEIGL